MRTKYSIKNFITITISNIVNFIFLFIAQTLFIKILGIEYIGLNGLFTNVLTVLSLFELGIGNAIIFSLYKYIHNDDKEQIKSLIQFYKKAYFIIAFSILIVGILIIPLLQFIVKDVTVDINIYIIYILFLLSTVASYILSYKRSIIIASQRSYIINIIHTIYIVLLNVVQLLVIYFTKNYYLYLIIKIIFILLENIVINIKANKEYSYLLDKNIKPLDINIKNDIVNRVKALFIHKTSAIVTNGTDNILISTFFGISTVGLYTSYNYIISCIDTFTKSVVSSASASVGDLLVDKNYKKRFQVFKRINYLNFWITSVTSVCLLLLIEPFITLWIGKEYLLETTVLVVLILNYYQSMMRSTFNVFKDAAGIWVEDKYVPLMQLSLNIISSIICLKLFGLCGVFIGTIISSFTVWFYSYPKFIYKKLFNKSYIDYYKDIFFELLKFLIIAIITFFITKIIVIDSLIISFIIKAIIAFIISNLLFILLNDKKYLKYYIKLLKNIVE